MCTLSSVSLSTLGVSPSPIDTEVDQFIEELRNGPKKSKDTLIGYEFVLKSVFLPWCHNNGVTAPRQMLDTRMSEWSDYLSSAQSDLSRESVRTYLRTVRVFLNWADVPRGKFRPPKPQKAVFEELSIDDMAAMRSKARDARDRLLIDVLWATGMRINEVLDLTIDDLEKRTNQTHLWVRGPDRRPVPITPQLWDRLRAFAEANETAHIFVSHHGGGRLTRNRAGVMIAELAVEAGIQRATRSSRRRVNPLLFRHSFAMRWLRAGGSVLRLQKILGHSSLHMIGKLYAELNEEEPFAEYMRLVKKLDV